MGTSIGLLRRKPAAGKFDVSELRQLMEVGKFRAVVDRTYPLEAIADAYRYVAKGEKAGIVVRIRKVTGTCN
jgi:NADPH:quinone reductase-like Zn-dependent oxidoreductase